MRCVDFPGNSDPSYLLPPPGRDLCQLLDGLESGRLVLQQCHACRRFRFPVAPVCPFCRDRGSDWAPLSGQGIVFSWIRYRKVYVPEYSEITPYVVVCVELEEGPRMVGRLLESESEVFFGQPVEMSCERWPNGVLVPIFRLQGS